MGSTFTDHEKLIIGKLERIYVEAVPESAKRLDVSPRVALAALLNGVVRVLSAQLSKQHAVAWLRAIADEVERDAVETTVVN